MADEEQQRMSDVHAPLLTSNRQRTAHITKTHSLGPLTLSSNTAGRFRHALRQFLTSKWGHYYVMILVTLDVAGIFADFLVSLHVLEHQDEDMSKWVQAKDGLGILSLVFSCLFMVELLCSIYAFGFAYFQSKFHCFDATAILASFLVDVLTRGPVEEAGSLIIILRLFRVFKIVEESSTVATEQIETYEDRIKELEEENRDLRRRVTATSMGSLGNGE